MLSYKKVFSSIISILSRAFKLNLEFYLYIKREKPTFFQLLYSLAMTIDNCHWKKEREYNYI